MTKGLRSLVRSVIGLKTDPVELESTDAALLRDVQKAHDEWRAALAYCDQVSDPEDVDFATYHLKSAQQRYTNLLKEAKQLGVSAWDLPMQEKALEVIRNSRQMVDDHPLHHEQQVVDG